MHQTHLYRKWQREKKKKWSTGDCRCVIMPFNCARATLCTHTSRQQTYEAMPPPNTICSRQKKNRIFRVRVHCSYALLSRSHCVRATLTPHTETYNTCEQRTCLNRSISDVDINENRNWILIGRKSNCSTRNRWMRRWCSMQSNTVYHLQQSAIDSLKCFCVLCHFTRKFILLFNAITGHKQCVCVCLCLCSALCVTSRVVAAAGAAQQNRQHETLIKRNNVPERMAHVPDFHFISVWSGSDAVFERERATNLLDVANTI